MILKIPVCLRNSHPKITLACFLLASQRWLTVVLADHRMNNILVLSPYCHLQFMDFMNLFILMHRRNSHVNPKNVTFYSALYSFILFLLLSGSPNAFFTISLLS